MHGAIVREDELLVLPHRGGPTIFKSVSATPECCRGSIHSKACQDTPLTFEDHCLEEEITFGDPFEDSGVAGAAFEASPANITGIHGELGPQPVYLTQCTD